MKVLVLLLSVVVGSYALPTLSAASKEWKDFKAWHKKVYATPAEDLLRLKIYLQNKQAILSANSKQRSFVVTMNKFGDMLKNEYKTLVSGKRARKTGGGEVYVNSGKPLPKSLDLRRNNLVNNPENQGSCASSWAFSATGAIEGQLAKRLGTLMNLSQQNMIDCAKLNGGCSGGSEDVAFKLARDGINLDNNYPYVGKAGSCKSDNNVLKIFIDGFQSIRSGNEKDLMDALNTVGPVAVGIDASSDLFEFYSSGVYAPEPTECRANNVGHSVLAVGYGTENGKDYWLIKNSFGTNWGENGFIKVLRTGTNFCGIASDPMVPIIY